MRNLRRHRAWLFGPVIVITLPFIFSGYQNFDDVVNDRAYTIFSRLAGKPPSDIELNLLKSKLVNGDAVGAAKVATADPDFINLTIRTFCAQMSTRALSPNIPMNDFTATCMGIVRDDTPVTDFTTSNYYYRVDPKKVPASLGVTAIDPDDPANLVSLYQVGGSSLEAQPGNHYQVLTGVDYLFDFGSSLVKREQQYYGSIVTGDANHGAIDHIYPYPDTAGLITSTQFLLDEGIGGTNRRLIQYVFHNFLCSDPGNFSDNGLVSGGGDDSYVAQDIDRFPGGDHVVYETSCKACHGIIDGMRGAFAYFDVYVETSVFPVYYNGVGADHGSPLLKDVVSKYHRNNNVDPSGHRTIDDSWRNLATVGQNADFFGWRGPTMGKGVHEFGVMVSKSKAFSRCMVQRAFQSVCGRAPSFDEQLKLVRSEADVLESDGYNLRHSFERLAASPECIEEIVIN